MGTLSDMATTIDLVNSFIRLGVRPTSEELDDLSMQFTIIKYRSHQAINDKHGGEDESNR